MIMQNQKFYLLRGGHIVRYQAGVTLGCGADQVIRKLTARDARMLRVRLVQLRVRRMSAEVAWIREVMRELRVSESKIPSFVTKTWAA